MDTPKIDARYLKENEKYLLDCALAWKSGLPLTQKQILDLLHELVEARKAAKGKDDG